MPPRARAGCWWTAREDFRISPGLPARSAPSRIPDTRALLLIQAGPAQIQGCSKPTPECLAVGLAHRPAAACAEVALPEDVTRDLVPEETALAQILLSLLLILGEVTIGAGAG